MRFFKRTYHTLVRRGFMNNTNFPNFISNALINYLPTFDYSITENRELLYMYS